VKPQFELGLPASPPDDATPCEALRRATGGIATAGWRLLGARASPVLGARGSREFFVYAERRT
jgi:predicted rRNA methylase YqxC with S4 and FtsJ domains